MVEVDSLGDVLGLAISDAEMRELILQVAEAAFRHFVDEVRNQLRKLGRRLRRERLDSAEGPASKHVVFHERQIQRLLRANAIPNLDLGHCNVYEGEDTPLIMVPDLRATLPRRIDVPGSRLQFADKCDLGEIPTLRRRASGGVSFGQDAEDLVPGGSRIGLGRPFLLRSRLFQRRLRRQHAESHRNQY